MTIFMKALQRPMPWKRLNLQINPIRENLLKTVTILKWSPREVALYVRNPNIMQRNVDIENKKTLKENWTPSKNTILLPP